MKHITKVHDQTVFGTTLTDDNELQFVAQANKTYGLHFDLVNSSDDVADLNGRVIFAVNAPSGSVVNAYCFALVGNGTTAPTQGPLTPVTQGEPGSWFGFGAPGCEDSPAYAWVRIAAQVTTGDVPGVVGLQFSEYADVDDSEGAVIYAGSSLFVTKG